MSHALRALPVLFLLAASCAESDPEGAAVRAPEQALLGRAPTAVQAFTGARVFDGTGAPVIEDGTVLVHEGVITAVGTAATVTIPPEAAILDLEGRWLLPGLVNAHGHVRGGRDEVLDQLELYAHYGVTTVLSLGDEAVDLSQERWRPELSYARGFMAGPSISPQTPEAARETVAGLAERGVDWIKSHLSGGSMPPAVYRAMIEEARVHDLPVAVHVEALAPAKGAVEAGAALVAHSVRDLPVDPELIDLMRSRGVCLVPTLTRELSTFVYAERPAFFDDPFFLERAAPPDLEGFLTPQRQAQAGSASALYWREALPLARANMVRLHQAGVGVAMGTDSGPVGRFQGYFEHLEMEMMVEAGMTPRDVLVSATGGAAHCIGLGEEVGTIQPGRRADFLVLEASPLEDIRNTRTIHGVWVAGNRVRGP